MAIFPVRFTSALMPAAAGCLVAGEVCGFALDGAAAAWPWLAGLTFLALLVMYGWNVKGMLLPIVFATGIVLGARTESERIEVINAMRFRSCPEEARVRVESGVGIRRAKNGHGKMVDFLAHIGPIPVKVIMPVEETGRLPSPGEVWLCRGRLACRKDATNRFSLQTLWVHDAAQARRLTPAENPALRWYARAGAFLAESVALGLEWTPEFAGLNQAILLGRRAGMSRDRRETFSAAGTMHVFAISGLHVMVVALAIGGLLARLDLPLQVRGLVAIPVLAAYVMLTGMRPSAIRAAAMMSLCLLAPVFGRRPDARTAWSITAIAVYGISPAKVFDLGCALSFAVMFGIVLWLRWAGELQPFVTNEGFLRKLAGSLGISLAAWVAGVPMTAHAFGQFSLGGLVANAVVVFCAQWVVRFGAFGIVAGMVCIPLAAIANNLAALCTALMAFVSELVAAVPFAVVTTPQWTLLHSAAWYCGWIAAFAAAGRFLPRKNASAAPWWL